jgi:hypothetical protein
MENKTSSGVMTVILPPAPILPPTPIILTPSSEIVPAAINPKKID